MKERPILFTPDNARKIYNGTKTQTRRIVKHKPTFPDDPRVCLEGIPNFYQLNDDEGGPNAWIGDTGPDSIHEVYVSCHLGYVGDRLWVKESFKRDPHNDCMVFYKDGTAIQCNRGTHPTEDYKIKQMSGMFMPRWASRSILEITDVRIERLQDISEEDAKAEGVDEQMIMNAVTQSPNPLPDNSWVGGFRWLWDSINRKTYPWSSNPWVWALTFRKTKPGESNAEEDRRSGGDEPPTVA